MEASDILNAIHDRLAGKWPDRTIYLDTCPAQVARPSICLLVEKNDWSDVNRSLIRRDLQLRLILYDAPDEQGNGPWYRLTTDFEQAIKLLLPVLQVGSRNLQLTCKALPRESDRAYAQINASWLDPRPTSEAAPEPPAATTAQVCVEIKNH